MSEPKELKEYLKSLKPSSMPLRYVETLEFKNNEFITHLWAIKYHKDFKEPKVKEIYRESESKSRMNTDFYFCGMGGWRVIFEEKRLAYYGEIEPKNKMVAYEGNRPGVEKCMLWNLNQVRELDPRLKYLRMKNHDTMYFLIDYIKRFREEPSLELLEKNNVEYLFTDSRVFKQSKKDKLEFIKWVSNHQDYILLNHPNYMFMKGCIKHKMTPTEYLNYQELVKYRSNLKSFKNDFEPNEMPKLKNYFEEQGIDFEEYKTYLKMCKKIGKNTKTYGVKFPFKFEQTQKEIEQVYKIILEKEEQEKLKKAIEKQKVVFEAIDNFSTKVNEFDIKPLLKPKDLIKVGEQLNNCLSTYVEKVQNGNCVVFAFFKKEEPIEACELSTENNKLQLVQLRGRNNQDSYYHDQCLKLVNELISSY